MSIKHNRIIVAAMLVAQAATWLLLLASPIAAMELLGYISRDSRLSAISEYMVLTAMYSYIAAILIAELRDHLRHGHRDLAEQRVDGEVRPHGAVVFPGRRDEAP